MSKKTKAVEKPRKKEVEIIRIHENPTTSTNDAELSLVELDQLEQSAGWQRIHRFYKEKMEVLESSFWKGGKAMTKEEINSLIDKRNMCTQFMNLPGILHTGIKLNIDSSNGTELDPYEKPKSFEQVAKELLG